MTTSCADSVTDCMHAWPSFNDGLPDALSEGSAKTYAPHLWSYRGR